MVSVRITAVKVILVMNIYIKTNITNLCII